MPAIIVDPELLAAVTRQFQLRGELQPFNLTENVVPIFDIGRLLALTPQDVVTPNLALMVAAGHSAALTHYAAAQPDSTVLNVADFTAAPAGGVVLADSGQLAAGQHHCVLSLSTDDATVRRVLVSHRNAANAADLATWQYMISLDHPLDLSFTATFAVNERVLWRTLVAFAGDVASNVSAAPSALDIAV